MVRRVDHLSALPRKLINRCLAKMQRVSLYRAASSHKRCGLEILEASEADLEKVHRTFDLEVKTPSMEDRDVVNFVAKKGQKVVGFAQLVRHSGGDKLEAGYYLFSLNVRPLYRGLGIGQDLTKTIMTSAKSEGVSELSVITNEDNRTALGLFRKLGFRMRRTEKETSWQGRKKCILVKTLMD